MPAAVGTSRRGILSADPTPLRHYCCPAGLPHRVPAPARGRTSQSGRAVIRCGTRSPRTCWRAARMFARFRSCSATPISARPWSTPTCCIGAGWGFTARPIDCERACAAGAGRGSAGPAPILHGVPAELGCAVRATFCALSTGGPQPEHDARSAVVQCDGCLESVPSASALAPLTGPAQDRRST